MCYLHLHHHSLPSAPVMNSVRLHITVNFPQGNPCQSSRTRGWGGTEIKVTVLFKFYFSRQDTARSEINYKKQFHQMFRLSHAPLVYVKKKKRGSVSLWLNYVKRFSRSNEMGPKPVSDTAVAYLLFSLRHHTCVNGSLGTGTIWYRPSQKVKLLAKTTKSEPSTYSSPLADTMSRYGLEDRRWIPSGFLSLPRGFPLSLLCTRG
jgi:hypothetical protein